MKDTISALPEDVKTQIVNSLDFRAFFKQELKQAIPKTDSRGNVNVYCPFHGEIPGKSSPSLSVNIQTGIYNCFGCDADGDVFTLYRHNHSCTFPEALKALAELAGVPLRNPSEKRPRKLPDSFPGKWEALTSHGFPEPGRAYLRGRGLTDETIAHLLENGLMGWNPSAWAGKPDTFKPAIAFPMTLPKGRIVGIQHVFPDGTPKLNMGKSRPKEGSFVIGDGEETVITEAIIDAISAWQACPHITALATTSSNILGKLEKETFGNPPILFFDNDRAGRDATENTRNLLGNVRLVSWGDLAEKDVNELLKAGKGEIIRLMIAEATAPRKTDSATDLSDYFSKIGTIPHNREAEIRLIASLMLDGGLLDRTELDPGDFHDPDCRTVFAEMRLTNSADPLTLRQRLPELADKITAICGSVPPASDPEAAAGIIRNLSNLRKLLLRMGKCDIECRQPDADFGTVLDRFQSEILRIGGSENDTVSVSEALDERFDRYENLWRQRGNAVTGIPSGYLDLDNLLSGFQPSDMIILAGRPGMGKTAAGMGMAANACRDGFSVGVFSLEMSRGQLIDRLVALESRIDLQCFRNGRFQQEDWDKLVETKREISRWKLHVDDTAALHHAALSRRARVMRESKGLDLLIIDYLQLMTGDTPKDPTLETTTISKAMKQLAKDLDIPVIVLSQLNRKLEERADKRPILSDLRQSGSLEQDADIVMFVYRDEVYDTAPDNPNKGIAEWLVRKHRHGPTADLRLSWEPRWCEFRNLSRHAVQF